MKEHSSKYKSDVSSLGLKSVRAMAYTVESEYYVLHTVRDKEKRCCHAYLWSPVFHCVGHQSVNHCCQGEKNNKNFILKFCSSVTAKNNSMGGFRC
jgi:hypothetical protein